VTALPAHRDASAPLALMSMVRAGRVSQSVYVAAKLGVADHLVAGPRRAEELAEAVGAHPGALDRLLRLLADVGVFAHAGDGCYALTPMGDLLRSDQESSLRGMVVLLESPFLRAAWTNLIESVRTGEAAFERAHGQHLFRYLRDHPDDAVTFDEAMRGISRQLTAAILDVYDFAAFGSVVDVGGGDGALLVAILARNPDTRGVLSDLPEVAARAKGLLATSGVAERCDVVAIDVFESVPAGGDAYLLSRVVHDWDDAAALRILRNVRAILPARARVLLVEAVLPDGDEPSLARVFDIEMLVIGGRERTEAEYRALLARAGLRLTRVVPSAGPFSVIEAVAAHDG
jgi:O-methyltransferase domain/Dimerisation domain